MISDYIGVTKLRLFKRLMERKNDLMVNRFSTVLSKNFLKGSNSFIDFDKPRIISKQVIPYSVAIRESMEIILRNQKICNDSVPFHISEIWDRILRGIHVFPAPSFYLF